MKNVLAFSLIYLLFSCNKNTQEIDLQNICFRARYVGTGCQQVIQVLDHDDQDWYNAEWTAGNQTYKHCVSVVSLPDSLLKGQTFIFTVASIDTTTFVTANCWSPKIFVRIAGFRDENCQPLKNN